METHTVVTIERRRSHIKMVGTLLKNARIDDRGLRDTLGEGASNLMRHWIRQLERQLGDLSALQCDCCSTWVPESDMSMISEQSRVDENPIDSVICLDCIDCPPDERDR